MSTTLPLSPFDPERVIGTLTEVGPTYVKANLPNAAIPRGKWLHGIRQGGGEVGEFAIIEVDELAVLGRITLVRLPERDRLSVQPNLGQASESHPIGNIQLLSTIEVKTGKVLPGVTRYPRLGSPVYSVNPTLLHWVVETAQLHDIGADAVLLDVAVLPGSQAVSVRLSPERLYGRHCAVLGTTGGGKSWTIARMIEETARFASKVILIDATGEYHDLKDGVQHVYMGAHKDAPMQSTQVVFPYQELEEGDLFALFRPSSGAQAPRLRTAIKSLKLAALVGEGGLVTNGAILKAGQSKKPFADAYRQHVAAVDGPAAKFDMTKLSRQIELECVHPSGWSDGKPDFGKWGAPNQQDLSYCTSLISRISWCLASPEFNCMFRPEGKPPLSTTIQSFLENKDLHVLRISLRHLPYANNVREIVANAIGRLLMGLARNAAFGTSPLVVFLDEAHQFVNRTVGDEFFNQSLDAFDLIAKEGRKYWLTLVLATQRPRDIPEGVLSQMGTLIVHRLTNDRDREVVERAAGDMDRSAAGFLPTLSQGEAVIIGVDFQFPLPVQIRTPKSPPTSKGPDYQEAWKRSAVEPVMFRVAGEIPEA